MGRNAEVVGPMSTSVAWALFVAYAVVTAVLALRGMRKTTTLKSFAIGDQDMGPVLVGVTLASSIASTATFVINPRIRLHARRERSSALRSRGDIGRDARSDSSVERLPPIR